MYGLSLCMAGPSPMSLSRPYIIEIMFEYEYVPTFAIETGKQTLECGAMMVWAIGLVPVWLSLQYYSTAMIAPSALVSLRKFSLPRKIFSINCTSEREILSARGKTHNLRRWKTGWCPAVTEPSCLVCIPFQSGQDKWHGSEETISFLRQQRDIWVGLANSLWTFTE